MAELLERFETVGRCPTTARKNLSEVIADFGKRSPDDAVRRTLAVFGVEPRGLKPIDVHQGGEDHADQEGVPENWGPPKA